jgi:DNA polymerase III subunit epsilon
MENSYYWKGEEMKLPKKFLAIDLETSGTNSNVHDVIQIGAVIVANEWEIVDEFTTYIQPLTETRDNEAMMVNKISEETLALAPKHKYALSEFEAFAKKSGMPAILMAWGAYFDVPFLHTYYDRVYRDWPFQWRSVDLKSIAMWELAKRDLLHKTDGRPMVFPGLTTCMKIMGLEPTGRKHDGLDDIRNAVNLVGQFLR